MRKGMSQPWNLSQRLLPKAEEVVRSLQRVSITLKHRLYFWDTWPWHQVRLRPKLSFPWYLRSYTTKNELGELWEMPFASLLPQTLKTPRSICKYYQLPTDCPICKAWWSCTLASKVQHFRWCTTSCRPQGPWISLVVIYFYDDFSVVVGEYGDYDHDLYMLCREITCWWQNIMIFYDDTIWLD